MITNTIKVEKSARYYLSTPVGPHIDDVWIVCHGYAQMARAFLNGFKVLFQPNRAVVAPEALNRFYMNGGAGGVGASWMTKEDRLNEISDYVNYLDRVYTEVVSKCADSATVTLLGFSQGTATVTRWALQGSSAFSRLIIWGGDFPADTHFPQARQRMETLPLHVVYGTDDPLTSASFISGQMQLLKREKIRFTMEYFNGKHQLNDNVLKRLAGHNGPRR